LAFNLSGDHMVTRSCSDSLALQNQCLSLHR